MSYLVGALIPFALLSIGYIVYVIWDFILFKITQNIIELSLSNLPDSRRDYIARVITESKKLRVITFGKITFIIATDKARSEVTPPKEPAAQLKTD